MRILTNFQYSIKGFKTDINNPSGASSKLAYLDVIPELEYDILNYISLGIGINYGIRITEHNRTGDEEWIRADKFKSSSASDFGVTSKLKMRFNDVFAFIRYNIGISDITNGIIYTDINGNAVDNASKKNRNLQIGIGYVFAL